MGSKVIELIIREKVTISMTMPKNSLIEGCIDIKLIFN